MDYNNFGKYIAYLRKKIGLTQEQLGEMLGISGKSVSKWERGITFPSVFLLKKLSKIMKVSCDELLEKQFYSPNE